MASRLTNFARTGRRLKNRCFGSGPWRAAPIASILNQRESTGSWHEPESIDGAIASVSHPAVAFQPGHALLGQSPRRYVMETGELRFHETGLSPAHTTTFWSLGQAGIIGEDGFVYCPLTRTAVAEISRTIWWPSTQHPALMRSHPRPRQLTGVALLLAGPFGHAHYHLIWDLLAKLALFPSHLRDAVDHYLVGMPSNLTTQSWLQAAGVPLERVTWLTETSHLLCEQLVFSNLPCECTQPRPAVHTALAELLQTGANPITPVRRLWLSRRGLPRRDLKWENEILRALPQFECIDASSLTARDQVRLFAEAVAIAGPHGSGFANLAFVQGRGDVIELFPTEQPYDPLFSRLAQIAGWRHHWAAVDFDQPAALNPLLAAFRSHFPSS